MVHTLFTGQRAYDLYGRETERQREGEREIE